MIYQFRGAYSFLSNFYYCRVEYEGDVYRSAEAAFQAAKCKDRTMRSQFFKLKPREAKKLGGKVPLREDWYDVRLQIMHDVLRAKFLNQVLAQKLMDTWPEDLINGNTWGDTYWGVDRKSRKGINMLGTLLTNLRDELRN